MASADFITMDQVCELLGKSPQAVKALVAEGRLHEFRDAGKVYYKRKEVADIAAKEGSSVVDLAADDEAATDAAAPQGPEAFGSALKSLSDEGSSSMGMLDQSPAAAEPIELSSGVGDALNLDESPPLAKDASASGSHAVELDLADIPEHLPASPPPALSSEIDLLGESDTGEHAPAAMPSAPAAADEIPDLGLSGSSIISLETGLDDVGAAPAKPKPAAPAKETGKLGKVGISVFDDDELQIPSDPGGETRISSGVDSLEAVGSGSGLLDLTQEKDDTSLGAELLDVISPTDAGETETEATIEAGETVEDTGGTMLETGDRPSAAEVVPVAGAPAAPRAPRAPAGEMAGTVPINISLGLGVAALAIVGLATAAQIQGAWPSFLTLVSHSVMHYSVFGGLLLIALVTGILGILAGRK